MAVKTAYKCTVVRLNVMLVKKETNQQQPEKDSITYGNLIYITKLTFSI